MASKLAFLAAFALALQMAIASSALAANIHFQRTAARGAVPLPSPSSLIAPPAVCPSQANASAPAAIQEQSMRCMTDFARAEAGLGALNDSQQLDLSAQEKAADVLHCDSFSHTACGRDFTYWISQSGYISQSCWHIGENLAWGAGALGTVRSIFKAWMRSPAHRRNILGDYEDLGLSLKVGELGGYADADVWSAHFGSHCGATTAEG